MSKRNKNRIEESIFKARLPDLYSSCGEQCQDKFILSSIQQRMFGFSWHNGVHA